MQGMSQTGDDLIFAACVAYLTPYACVQRRKINDSISFHRSSSRTNSLLAAWLTCRRNFHAFLLDVDEDRKNSRRQQHIQTTFSDQNESSLFEIGRNVPEAKRNLFFLRTGCYGRLKGFNTENVQVFTVQ